MHALLLSAALFAASVSASPLQGSSAAKAKWARDLVKKSSIPKAPRGWEQVDVAVREDTTITLSIGLKQRNADKLIDELYAVSDPLHPRYGKHLTKEQVEDLVAPHEDSISVVNSWLEDHGIDLKTAKRSAAKDWVTVTVPVSVASELAGADYRVFRDTESGKHVVRSLEYSIPRSLSDHIDTVQPTNFFGLRQLKVHSKAKGKIPEALQFAEDIAPAVAGAVPASCASTITPACLRALYNTVNYTPTQSKNNTIGVTGYLEEYANNADLQTFFKKYRTDATGFTFTTVTVNGGLNNQNDPGVEANLDIQYTTGINYPTQAIFYSTGGSPPYTPDDNTESNTNEPYLDWLNYITGLTTIPATFSTSYGDDEQSVPLDYADRVCNTFAQLGARGSSVLFSSGDGGVGSGDCESNTGSGKTEFLPTFPGACPFVTSVGATTGTTEKAASFSQGGFSNYFGIPSYQASAVKTFLTAQGTTYSTYYNASGRGFPDVSAQGENFAVVIGGSVEAVDGTSCSSPTFSAVVSLLNDYRLSQGKATLGFLNPWLYGAGLAGLNDVTSGSNPGCGTSGFSAKKGWDPVTGLGTPNFTKLQTLLPA